MNTIISGLLCKNLPISFRREPGQIIVQNILYTRLINKPKFGVDNLRPTIGYKYIVSLQAKHTLKVSSDPRTTVLEH